MGVGLLVGILLTAMIGLHEGALARGLEWIAVLAVVLAVAGRIGTRVIARLRASGLRELMSRMKRELARPPLSASARLRVAPVEAGEDPGSEEDEESVSAGSTQEARGAAVSAPPRRR